MGYMSFPAGTDLTDYFTSDGTFDAIGNWVVQIDVQDTDPADSSFETSDVLTATSPGQPGSLPLSYLGFVAVGGVDYPVFEDPTNGVFTVMGIQLDSSTFPTFSSLPLNTGDFDTCFAAGTLIATPHGEVAIETLKVGDLVLTAAGTAVPVRWLGQQTLSKRFSRSRAQLVRISAGTLGTHSDLYVTGDHGMIVDDHIINASALVNGTTVSWVPLADTPDTVTVYHIETDAHDVLLANGAAAESFLDAAGRGVFDNPAEYEALYGTERLIQPIALPRISAHRMLPPALRAKLAA